MNLYKILSKKQMRKISNELFEFAYLLAFAVMCVTNFAIDAPLTALLTNKLQSKVLEKEASSDKEKVEDLYA